MQYVRRKPELYHHGILGQRWGVRNGPPYPLGSGAHSESEEKAGWKKSVSSGLFNKKNKKSVSEVKPQSNSSEQDDIGTKYFIGSRIKNIRDLGFKVHEEPNTIEDDAKKVNPHYSEWSLFSDYQMNCTNCVMTYALRRFGLDVEANALPKGRPLQDMEQYFKGCFDKTHCSVVNFNPRSATSETVRLDLSKACEKLCGDDAGVGFIAVRGPFICHVISWEKEDSGKVRFIDSQSNHIDDRVIERYFNYVSKGKQLVPSVLVSRIDNCQVEEKKMKDVCQNSRGSK